MSTEYLVLRLFQSQETNKSNQQSYIRPSVRAQPFRHLVSFLVVGAGWYTLWKGLSNGAVAIVQPSYDRRNGTLMELVLRVE